MKTKLLIILICLIAFNGFSQNKQIEQIKNHLETKSPNDSTKVKAYYSLAQQYASFSKDSFSSYTNRALALSLKTNNYLLPQIYNYKGIEYLMKSKSDSARIYLNKALSVLDETKDNETKAIVYQNFANSYEGSGNFDKKVGYVIKSIDLLEDNPFNQCTSLFNLGALYAQSEMYNKALEYFNKALDVSKTGKNIRMENASLMAIGAQHLKLNQLDNAKIALEKSLEICKKTNATDSYFETYSKLGGLYDKMKLYDKSEKARINAKEYAEKLGVESKIMQSIGSLAGHYLTRKNYKKAANYYKKWEALYEKNPRMDIGVIAYKNWAEVEGHLGNVEKSSKLLEKFLAIKDSIYSKENRAIINDTEAKYETEKKDKEIAQQQLTLEKSQAKTQTMTILIISLLVASILLWSFFRQRQKRIQQQLITIQKEQEVRTLESLIAGEEKERLRIAKELHDGVNGDLSAIKYKLSSLLKMNNEVINEAVTMIDNSCQQVRAISHNLVPPSLKDFNLIEAVSNYCENMNNTHQPDISFQHIGASIDLNKKVEVNIFRIVQELVTNATKHANAKAINVQISNRNNTLLITVEDNGEGYKNSSEKKTGIGLENIKSRVEYLNANLEVITNTNGTSNTLEINLNTLNDN